MGHETREELGAILGVYRRNTGKYLEIPSLVGRNRADNFRYIRDRLWTRLQNWRGQKISKAGKEILIKATTQAIPNHCMSTLLLPTMLLGELDRMLNSFLWGHDIDPKMVRSGNVGIVVQA